MSRIGRRPVVVPNGVRVSVDGRKLHVEGPLGKLDAILPEGVEIVLGAGDARVEAPSAARGNAGYRGLVRALLANMVEGVVKGYERSLEISGVGYKAELKGDVLTFFLGYTHHIDLPLPKGIVALLDKTQTKVTVKGIDKQLVGQVAAQIRHFKNPEPYKGKGVKYDKEVIRRKVGKAGAK